MIAGYFEIRDRETGQLLDEGETLRCCHCQKNWRVRRGSGTTRGWCWRCGAATCGKAACERCVPWEMALEVAESRLSLASALHRIRGL